MKYRVLKPLSTGHRPGQVIDDSELTQKGIVALVRVKALSPISFPPVRVLRGWEERAEKLERMAVNDVGEFLDADTDELAAGMEEEPEAVEAMKIEAAEAVRIEENSEAEPSDEGCTGCSGR